MKLLVYLVIKTVYFLKNTTGWYSTASISLNISAEFVNLLNVCFFLSCINVLYQFICLVTVYLNLYNNGIVHIMKYICTRNWRTIWYLLCMNRSNKATHFMKFCGKSVITKIVRLRQNIAKYIIPKFKSILMKYSFIIKVIFLLSHYLK